MSTSFGENGMIDYLLDGLQWSWLLASLVGIGFSWAGLQDARYDRQYLEQRRLNGARRIVARAAVRRERLRLMLLSVFALVGVIGVAQPWLAASPIPPDLLRLAVRGVACLAVLHLVLVTILDRRDRQLLLRTLAD